ncbi:hypothetical protein I5907_16830 [Panacibacter sp. DH6]|uniref:GLPGLI family protein n=1 Tax=Panacibacter microcysteis TaxID=2793269 RepID=A0A931GYX1_9BACT|nr:hypothetical protein [Panacibacter microcysteis]MBG9377908.1 hypothetical protein [Panacibacter microcysteis]
MKFLITTIISTALYLTSFATAQYPDKIFFNGKEYALLSNPLEAFFEKNPERRPEGGVISSALWRGYVATFEVRDNQLFVKDIQIIYINTTDKNNHDDEWKSVMEEVFPEQKDVKVDWLTGLLVLPHGKIVNYVHMGYGSTYEKYFLLEIDKGDYIKSKQFDYEEYEKFKDKQFEEYKKTEEYKETKAKLKKEGNSDEYIDNFLRSFVTDYTSKILPD